MLPNYFRKQYDAGKDAQGNYWLWDYGRNKMAFYGKDILAFDSLKNNLALQGYTQEVKLPKKAGSNKNVAPQANVAKAPSNIEVTDGVGIFGGGGYSAPKPRLDQSQINSLLASLGIYDTDRNNAKRQAAIKRDTFKREKDEELKRERGKYNSKKQEVAQEYGTARTDTDLNARNTLQNLLSSLSTLGMGGSRELTRQILAAANQSNRQANTTQAKNNQKLDSAFNEYKGGYDNDIRKINDQYGADVAAADKTWAEKRRDTLHRIGSVYGQADRAAERDNYMRQGDSLNSIIANSAFMSPSYTGESRAMATPELASYNQDVAQYDTTAIGSDQANGANVSGNLAMKAIAVNDKDFGIKKKNEADLGYGV